MRPTVLWVAILGLGWTASALLCPSPLRAQQRALPEHYYQTAGCYEITPEHVPEWLVEVERRLQLSTTLLAPVDGFQVPRLVARAAPGERASVYPAVSWVLVGETQPLQIVWEFPGFSWIVATFPLAEGMVPEAGSKGEIRYDTDIADDEWEPITASLRRIKCLSQETLQPNKR